MRFDDLSPLPLQDTTLTIQSSEGSFEAMQQHLSPELSSQVRDIKYKSVIRWSDVLLEELDTASLDLTERFSDRKVLLKRFLQQKYDNQSGDYIRLLEELKII